MTFSISTGWDLGWHIYWGEVTKRVCMGWVSFTYYAVNADLHFAKALKILDEKGLI